MKYCAVPVIKESDSHSYVLSETVFSKNMHNKILEFIFLLTCQLMIKTKIITFCNFLFTISSLQENDKQSQSTNFRPEMVPIQRIIFKIIPRQIIHSCNFLENKRERTFTANNYSIFAQFMLVCWKRQLFLREKLGKIFATKSTNT